MAIPKPPNPAVSKRFASIGRDLAGLPSVPVRSPKTPPKSPPAPDFPGRHTVSQGRPGTSRARAAGLDIPGMVRIPRTPFVLYRRFGASDRVRLPEYWIGATAVTNEQFDAFWRSALPTFAISAAAQEGTSSVVLGHVEQNMVAGVIRCLEGIFGGGLQAQLQAEPIARSVDASFAYPQQPVTNITWFDALAYCAWFGMVMSDRLGISLRGRLPTEAEWERAARGKSGRDYIFPHWTLDEAAAWFGNLGSDIGPEMVGQKRPNSYGLYDMIGNVNEWCLDVAGRESSFAIHDQGCNPALDDPSERVIRGGNCLDRTREHLHAGARKERDPHTGDRFVGFRCVLTVAS